MNSIRILDSKKKEGLNVTDLLDNDIKLDSHEQFYKLPRILKERQDMMKRDDINYGYLVKSQQDFESSNLVQSSLLNENFVSLSVNDYLNNISDIYQRDRYKNKKTNLQPLQLTTSTIGNQIEIYENDLRNIGVKTYTNKFLRKPEFLDSDTYVSSKTKLHPMWHTIEKKKKFKLNQNKCLENLIIQNKEYPWINLEKYLNTSLPKNPPTTPNTPEELLSNQYT